jgi:hypothetical protein
MCLSASAL